MIIGSYNLDSSLERIGNPNHAITIKGAKGTNAQINATTMIFDGDATIDDILINFTDNKSWDDGKANIGGLVYAEYNHVTFGTGVTTAHPNSADAAYVYGGKYDTTSWTDTHLTIMGGDWCRVFGNSDKHNGVAHNTYVEFGGNATAVEVFGGGHYMLDSGDTFYNSVDTTTNVTISCIINNDPSIRNIGRVFGGGKGTKSYANKTNVVINDGSFNQVWGGTTNGASVEDTMVTINGGRMRTVYGGNEVGSVKYGEAGSNSTKIYFNDGILEFQLFGGCYNSYEASVKWSSPYYDLTFNSNSYVDGTTYVYIGDISEENLAQWFSAEGEECITEEEYEQYKLIINLLPLDTKELVNSLRNETTHMIMAISVLDVRNADAEYITNEDATFEFSSQAVYDAVKDRMDHPALATQTTVKGYDHLIVNGEVVE